MRMRNKKTFQTEQLNSIREKEKRSWLIFIYIMMFLAVWAGTPIFSRIGQEWSGLGILYFLLLDILCSLLIGMVPFYFRRARLKGEYAAALQNCSFITVNDLDYYRDKLTGLHPTEISLLTDLKIETDKDINACLMLYTDWGIVKEENGVYKRFSVPPEKLAELKESDLFLLDRLNSRMLPSDIEKWKSLVIEEAKADGYITDKNWLTAATDRKTRLIVFAWCILFLIAVMPIGCMSLSNYYTTEPELLSGLNLNAEAVPKPVLDMIHLAWSTGNIVKNAMSTLDKMDNVGYTGAALYFSNNPARLAGILFMVLYLAAAVLVIVLPILYMNACHARVMGQIPLKRTAVGDEYSELIYGMKNFIHDFSNLNEADKGALALWDDYLIYAVVLEENKRIIDEITERKGR